MAETGSGAPIRIVIEAATDEAARQLLKIAAGLKEIKGAGEGAAAGVDKTTQSLGEANKKVKEQNDFASELANTWRTNFAAGIFIAEKAIESLTLAYGNLRQVAVLDETRLAFDRYAASVSVGSEVILDKLRKAANGTFADFDLMRTASKAMSLGVTKDADQLASLLEIARNKSRLFGVDTAKAFEDISIGIGRLSPRILDNLGIRIPKAFKELTEGMSDTQKIASLLELTLKDGQREIKEMGGIVETAADSFRKLEAAAATTKQSIGRELLEEAENTNDFVREYVLPLLEDWAMGYVKLAGAVRSFAGVIGRGTLSEETLRKERIDEKLTIPSELLGGNVRDVNLVRQEYNLKAAEKAIAEKARLEGLLQKETVPGIFGVRITSFGERLTKAIQDETEVYNTALREYKKANDFAREAEEQVRFGRIRDKYLTVTPGQQISKAFALTGFSYVNTPEDVARGKYADMQAEKAAKDAAKSARAAASASLSESKKAAREAEQEEERQLKAFAKFANDLTNDLGVNVKKVSEQTAKGAKEIYNYATGVALSFGGSAVLPAFFTEGLYYTAEQMKKMAEDAAKYNKELEITNKKIKEASYGMAEWAGIDASMYAKREKNFQQEIIDAQKYAIVISQAALGLVPENLGKQIADTKAFGYAPKFKEVLKLEQDNVESIKKIKKDIAKAISEAVTDGFSNGDMSGMLQKLRNSLTNIISNALSTRASAYATSRVGEGFLGDLAGGLASAGTSIAVNYASNKLFGAGGVFGSSVIHGGEVIGQAGDINSQVSQAVTQWTDLYKSGLKGVSDATYKMFSDLQFSTAGYTSSKSGDGIFSKKTTTYALDATAANQALDLFAKATKEIQAETAKRSFEIAIAELNDPFAALEMQFNDLKEVIGRSVTAYEANYDLQLEVAKFEKEKLAQEKLMRADWLNFAVQYAGSIPNYLTTGAPSEQLIPSTIKASIAAAIRETPGGASGVGATATPITTRSEADLAAYSAAGQKKKAFENIDAMFQSITQGSATEFGFSKAKAQGATGDISIPTSYGSMTYSEYLREKVKDLSGLVGTAGKDLDIARAAQKVEDAQAALSRYQTAVNAWYAAQLDVINFDAQKVSDIAAKKNSIAYDLLGGILTTLGEYRMSGGKQIIVLSPGNINTSPLITELQGIINGSDPAAAKVLKQALDMIQTPKPRWVSA